MTKELAASDPHLDEEMLIAYKKSALSVVTFKIHYSEDDYKNKRYLQFKPDMAHQVFGESECIYGYRQVSITLNYLHNSSQCHVEVSSSGVVPIQDQQPDNIMECLNSWMPENFTTDADKFLDLLKNEKHDLLFGTVLTEFKDTQCSNLYVEQVPKYKITLCDSFSEEFKDFHRRFETFIVWFIDGANFIDLDDSRWLIFYVYEELRHPVTKKVMRTPVGFCTVYKFFSYPSNIRARVSQFFVLPSHQKRGIGTHLYREVVKKLREMPDVIDITVEEPTSTFRRIRDLDDAHVLHNALEKLGRNFKTTPQEEVFKLMKQFKLCKRQSQRVYDILSCYYYSIVSLFEYKKCVEKIKRRMAFDIEKESKVGKRFCNLERGAVLVEPSITQASIDSEHKKYLDDIEPCVRSLKRELCK